MDPRAQAMILKRFERPDEVRPMTLGRFELVQLGGMTVGRAIYQPGWRDVSLHLLGADHYAR